MTFDFSIDRALIYGPVHKFSCGLTSEATSCWLGKELFFLQDPGTNKQFGVPMSISLSSNKTKATHTDFEKISFFRVIPTISQFFKAKPSPLLEISLKESRSFTLLLKDPSEIKLANNWILVLGKKISWQVDGHNLRRISGMGFKLEGQKTAFPITNVDLKLNQRRAPTLMKIQTQGEGTAFFIAKKESSLFKA